MTGSMILSGKKSRRSTFITQITHSRFFGGGSSPLGLSSCRHLVVIHLSYVQVAAITLYAPVRVLDELKHFLINLRALLYSTHAVEAYN